MGNAAHHGHEALPLGWFARGEGEGAHCPPVEAAVEADELCPARVVTRQLDGGLDGLGPGVAEEDHRRLAEWRQGGQPLRKLHPGRVVIVG
jgi:hypothetical protein